MGRVFVRYLAWMGGCLLLATVVWGSGETMDPAGSHVFVNQIGYLPSSAKPVICDRPATEFTVRAEETGKPVYRGRLTSFVDATSKRRVWRGDFRELTVSGRYHVEVPGVGISYSFRIGEDVYREVLRLGLRFYYLQRCGVALDDPETGLTHAACHLDDAYLWYADPFYAKGARLVTAGGWHDAGDYGKYVSTTAVTVAHLLCLYELWPERCPDGWLRIPESGNGFPDVLDEARIGLDWLLTMQRPDGAVYHKVGGTRWPTLVRPEVDTGPRYVYGVSTFATAKFAAVMAMAARVFEGLDPIYARRCDNAARLAWDYLENHGFAWEHSQFDDEGSGAYAQDEDDADRLWAAAELVLRGEKIEELEERLKRYIPNSIGWSDAALLGLFDLARNEAIPADLRRLAAEKIFRAAEKHFAATKASAYGYTLHYADFGWASNKEALARGVVMLLADRLQANPDYRAAALAQLNFVLGLNPLGKCFVTGLGSDPVRMPHHRFDATAPKSVPGMLVGGPNNRAESGVEPYELGPYSYADSRASYSSNEPAIDYNAALIFAAAAFAGE
ncbi:MAG: glycoside hydrolase family 9 protein [Firmicutes bacterium]|nr:glycoside hydrolase family 9 protein [Bacillota bacterium]